VEADQLLADLARADQFLADQGWLVRERPVLVPVELVALARLEHGPLAEPLQWVVKIVTNFRPPAAGNSIVSLACHPQVQSVARARSALGLATSASAAILDSAVADLDTEQELAAQQVELARCPVQVLELPVVRARSALGLATLASAPISESAVADLEVLGLAVRRAESAYCRVRVLGVPVWG